MGSYSYSEILSGFPGAQTLPAHPRGCCNNTGLHKRISSKKKVSEGTAHQKSYFSNWKQLLLCKKDERNGSYP